jgi:hypothetical protein
MMHPDEIENKTKALLAMRDVVETYKLLLTIVSVDIYYDGHAMTRHGSIQIEPQGVSAVVRQALVAHWSEKVLLEAANMRSHNVDPTSLIPEELR